jgi:hypothetical protein
MRPHRGSQNGEGDTKITRSLEHLGKSHRSNFSPPEWDTGLWDQQTESIDLNEADIWFSGVMLHGGWAPSLGKFPANKMADYQGV